MGQELTAQLHGQVIEAPIPEGVAEEVLCRCAHKFLDAIDVDVGVPACDDPSSTAQEGLGLDSTAGMGWTR